MCKENIMKSYGVGIVLSIIVFIYEIEAQCSRGRPTFGRWSGLSPDRATPVFVYSASGEEESLTGACLARCRELEDCTAVVVMYTKGNCQGIAAMNNMQFRVDNDAAYFKKLCLPLPEECVHRWWALESTPGYHLHADGPRSKMVVNSTMQECYEALLVPNREKLYRSSQWILSDVNLDTELIKTADDDTGSCVLNVEDKFTEPESYRVSNYYTFYMENQCRHDYLKKIDRCSYEEYYNQTLKHVEFTYKNYTKDECKRACEIEERFVCRGFTWRARRPVTAARGLCDLHSEDLVTTGSWLLRRTSGATYYRRVICLNLTVDCEESDLIVTYRPRGVFRGLVYVPGHGEKCSARSRNGVVRLTLPMYGECNINFAYGISNGPDGVINRTMAYVMIMIQNNPIIQTAGDRWVRVGCSPGLSATRKVDATVSVRDNAKPSAISDASSVESGVGAAAVFGGAAPVTLSVVRGEAGAAAVTLGEILELRLDTTEPKQMQAYHLVASSRLGDSSLLLLDSRGCPTGQVDFPSFTRTWVGGVQRLSARFKAFRFPTSHIVRFAVKVRFCEVTCPPVNCGNSQLRATRQTNETYYSDEVPASVQSASQVVAVGCREDTGTMSLEVEVLVDSKEVLSADTLVRADHRSTFPEDNETETAVVCVHELLLVALTLAWLAVQLILLLGCCVLVKRYRNLAEMNMQKDYHSFDNGGFDTVSTHRRVHWPDQHIDLVH